MLQVPTGPLQESEWFLDDFHLFCNSATYKPDVHTHLAPTARQSHTGQREKVQLHSEDPEKNLVSPVSERDSSLCVSVA